MFSDLRKSTMGAALRMGGFIGWYLTVMYICEQSLRFYRDDTMLSSVNITFMLSSFITGGIIAVILLLFDIEGLLSHRLLRWLPGIFMAESGIALSLANASTMTAFAFVAGIGSAFGALAVISHLLRVKVGQRLQAIAFGMAFGGIVRLIAILLIGNSPTKISLIAAAAAIGIFAALSVHSRGYSSTGSSLISFAEAEPRKMLSKIPYIYIVLFFFSLAFYFAHSHIETATIDKIASVYTGYGILASLGFIAAALVSAVSIKLPWLAMLFVTGAGISAAAAMMTGLPYLTSGEAAFFAVLSYAALSCVKIGFYIIIVIFSLDRPHPLFYAFLGYTAVIFGELCGRTLDRFVNTPSLSFYVTLLLLLMPIGGWLITHFMKRAGFTQDQLDHRHNAHSLIRRKSAELKLSEREQTIVEYIVLDGCSLEEIASKLFFSRNTVRMLLGVLLPKFKTDSIEELRSLFDGLTENEERFLAEVHAAEEERRAAEKAEQTQRRLAELSAKSAAAAAAHEAAAAEKEAEDDGIVIGGTDDTEEDEFLESADETAEEFINESEDDEFIEDSEAEDEEEFTEEDTAEETPEDDDEADDTTAEDFERAVTFGRKFSRNQTAGENGGDQPENSEDGGDSSDSERPDTVAEESEQAEKPEESEHSEPADRPAKKNRNRKKRRQGSK